MSATSEPAGGVYGATVRPYRSPFAHLPLAVGGFVAIVAVVLAARILDASAGSGVASVTIVAGGVLFLLFVLTLPRTSEMLRRRGTRRIEVDPGEIRLLDAEGRRVLGRAPNRDERLTRARFHYAVQLRGGIGERFHAPLLTVRLDGHAPIHIGVLGSPSTWAGDTELLTIAPTFVVDAETWDVLLSHLGQDHLIVPAGDTRLP